MRTTESKKILELEIFAYMKKNGTVKKFQLAKFLMSLGIKKTKAWQITNVLTSPFNTREDAEELVVLPMLEEVFVRDSLGFRRVLKLTKEWEEKNEQEVRNICNDLIVPTVIN